MRMKSSGAFRWLRLAVGPADSYERPLRVALEATERDTTGADTLPEREAAVLRLVVLCAAELRVVLWEAELREVDCAAELRELEAATELRDELAAELREELAAELRDVLWAALLRVVLCEAELRDALEDEPRLWAPIGAAAKPAARIAVIARVKNVFIMPLVFVIRINNTWSKRGCPPLSGTLQNDFLHNPYHKPCRTYCFGRKTG